MKTTFRRLSHFLLELSGDTFDDITDPIIGNYKSIHDIIGIFGDWISELESEWKDGWRKKNML